MHSFIMKITHSLVAKDAIAIARGMYKVIESGSGLSSDYSIKGSKSWHDKL